MWKVAIVGGLLIGVLYLATRQPVPSKPAEGGASNALLFAGLTNILAFGQKLVAPTKTPSLTDSKTAADDAVAKGLPVSSTQDNGLFTPSFLDGSSLVSA
jgi:hypothetical protein